MTEPDPRIDAILAAISQLTTVVGALAQHVASADTAASASDVRLPVLSQDDGYAALCPLDDENATRRTRLAADLGILSTPGGEELIRHGARGFYRALHREEGRERIELPVTLARRLVEDALLEDHKEAADMGADLLKIWEADDADDFVSRGGVNVLAKVKGESG